MMPKCLVLGADGFMGSHLSEKLVEAGHEVVCFDRFRNGEPRHIKGLSFRTEVVHGDIRATSALDKALTGCDIVFHFASAIKPYSDSVAPGKVIEEESDAAIQLFDLCVRHKIKKIIFPSTGGAVYGGMPLSKSTISETHAARPELAYAIHKRGLEKVLAQYASEKKLNSCVLRISNCYGPRAPLRGTQGVISIFMRHLADGEPPLIYGDGRSVRDYVYVTDVISAIILSAMNPTRHAIYNIGAAEGYSVIEIFEKIREIAERDIRPVFREARQNEIPRIVLNTDRFRREFLWRPRVDFETGLRQVWQWIVNETQTSSLKQIAEKA
ncbi:MAG: NAD-dependent epimerase/dehydratase family protein [Candidatus Omnitrophota bacterium]|nr:NAD-dependent epimerase/dehydratase family protein [Candidatus Omnitrophota bacterium]